MFERILIPLDGSPRAEFTLGQVGRILRREDSEVLLLRVIQPPVDPMIAERTPREDERLEAQTYLDDVIRRFSDQGMKVHGRIAEGPPSETIVEQAKLEGATLIAMTTHGRSGLSRWVMGSVAERVVRTSPVPVFLIRSFRTSPQGALEPVTADEFRFRKILVPTDGSPASEEAVAPAIKFAQLCDSEIIVLHVETPVILPGTEVGVLSPVMPTPSEDDSATARTAARFRHAGLQVTRLTVLGDPAAEIVDQSLAVGIDLIALATHGRSGLSRWFLGSVAERVLRHSGVPLLLVRAEKTKGRLKEGSTGKRKLTQSRQ